MIIENRQPDDSITLHQRIKILSVNTSQKKGTVKKPVSSIHLTEIGVVGDAHSGKWHRQVSLLATESIAKFSEEAGRAIQYGEFAENITTEGLLLHHCHPLDRFCNETLELEVTQIGKKCHGDNCSIFREVGNCVMPTEGIFARVIRGGNQKAGDELDYRRKVINISIITLAERASAGKYGDKRGPQIKNLTKTFIAATNQPTQMPRKLAGQRSVIVLRKQPPLVAHVPANHDSMIYHLRADVALFCDGAILRYNQRAGATAAGT